MPKSCMSGPWGSPPIRKKNSKIISATTPSSSGIIPERPSIKAWLTILRSFLSRVPDLFYRGMVPINVALIQTSSPDIHGYMSLGISVDITKAAVEKASLVIAQVNQYMPRAHGDGFIHIEDIDFIICHDEPLLEYEAIAPDETARQIGKYVSRIVQDGDTIQVGYGSLPNAILSNFGEKKHLGVHTELLTDGLVDLIKKGVIDNSRKTLNRGKTVATFCMGHRKTYEFLEDNPSIEFRTIDYTNNPLTISRQKNMTAINSALEIDLTGQVTAESLGKTFYSGIGGQADFMRGAVLAPGGKSILAIQATAEWGKVSRIVPFLREGAGVTLIRGDIHYVVTEYGIAYLLGKNIRERAMALISIAHPDFRPWLIEKAKEANLIYRDQAFIPGKKGEYPEHLEIFRTTAKGLPLLLRPVKISDEPLLKGFFLFPFRSKPESPLHVFTPGYAPRTIAGICGYRSYQGNAHSGLSQRRGGGKNCRNGTVFYQRKRSYGRSRPGRPG